MPAPSDPLLRREYLARLRREIDAGTYETPEKLAAALDNFLDHPERGDRTSVQRTSRQH
jgi:hypothetical protein